MEELTNVIKQICEMKHDELVTKCAAMFDSTCIPWTEDRTYNLMFLGHQEVYANDLLKAKGFIFLNDVYEMLGMKKTALGQLVGWVYEDMWSEVEFKVLGDLIIFNIDGIILDKI